jgi:hypothetical protein
MSSRKQCPSDEAELPNLLLNKFRFAHYGDLQPAWMLQPACLNLMSKNSDRGLQTQPAIVVGPRPK